MPPSPRCWRWPGARPADVERFIHGTTVATNAVLEQKGAVTAILTTEGFEDVLELGRMKRSRMYDLAMDPEVPTFLAPRRRRIGIRERLDARGQVLVPLDEDAVRAAVPALRAQAVQAIAVCYLFSFVNPAHERRTREIVAELAPEISVSLSSEVDPDVPRVRAAVRDGLRRLPRPGREALPRRARRHAARASASPACRSIMRSRGGIVSAALAAQQPVTLFLSGPAGGVIGARLRRRALGRARLRLARHGRHQQRRRRGPRRRRHSWPARARSVPIPVRTPMVDVNTIGAGGGSIAWIDAAGGLRVGPRSAGADPGPACYGRGGDEATVTDASVVLGYLNPARFAGGTLRTRRRGGRARGSRGRAAARAWTPWPPPPASIAW